MGKHTGPIPIPRPDDEDHEELSKLVSPEDGWPEEFPEDRPSNPDLWGHDSFYDTEDKSGRLRATVAVALCVVVTGMVGSIGWMFGTGQADAGAPVSTTTETVTELVTPKSQVTKTEHETIPASKGRAKATATKTITKAPSPAPAKTIYSTMTVTPKPSISVKISKVPGPTVTKTVIEYVTEPATDEPPADDSAIDPMGLD